MASIILETTTIPAQTADAVIDEPEVSTDGDSTELLSEQTKKTEIITPDLPDSEIQQEDTDSTKENNLEKKQNLTDIYLDLILEHIKRLQENRLKEMFYLTKMEDLNRLQKAIDANNSLYTLDFNKKNMLEMAIKESGQVTKAHVQQMLEVAISFPVEFLPVTIKESEQITKSHIQQILDLVDRYI